MRLSVDIDGLDPADKAIKIAEALTNHRSLSAHELRVIGAYLLIYIQKCVSDK